jgi:hypothetical protein
MNLILHNSPGGCLVFTWKHTDREIKTGRCMYRVVVPKFASQRPFPSYQMLGRYTTSFCTFYTHAYDPRKKLFHARQMYLYFHSKKSPLGRFWKASGWKMLVYFTALWYIFCHLEILRSFSTFSVFGSSYIWRKIWQPCFTSVKPIYVKGLFYILCS